ncbi:secreted RxLR effector protein 161-like [Nicotiana tomentosiformis]|uniref:secreted RxLR effector protein 161-like n=1 Tax=Nicotiana tomentosiformis TaxID=4098 RepID=UPI00388C51F0
MGRPDIAFVVQVLSQHIHAPKQSHMEAAIRVVKYVKGTTGLGRFIPAKENKQLVAYCDSDWGSCVETRKSIIGYIVKFDGALISWKSKKQSTISRSSVESEFKSMAATVAEVTWLVGLFGKLGVTVNTHMQVFCDSKAAIQIAAHPIFHERTKHFDIDCHSVRGKIQAGQIQTQHIGTKEQPVDLLTKSLCKLQHEYLINKLEMKNLFYPST